MPLDARPVFTVPGQIIMQCTRSYMRISQTALSLGMVKITRMMKPISQSYHQPKQTCKSFFEITHLGQIQRFCLSERG